MDSLSVESQEELVLFFVFCFMEYSISMFRQCNDPNLCTYIFWVYPISLVSRKFPKEMDHPCPWFSLKQPKYTMPLIIRFPIYKRPVDKIMLVRQNFS
jgi:hypothetical protein